MFLKQISKKLDYGSFFENIEKRIGHVDLLINNSSTFNFDTIRNTNYEIFDSHVNVNLKLFFLSNTLKNLKKNGLIINIIDQRVKNITPYFTSYTLSNQLYIL